MLTLGVESSAHTFGIGIVDDGKILANEKSMYKIGTTGMIPKKVAEFHVENSSSVLEMALARAGVKASEIGGIAYTRGPGIGSCLQVGQTVAKTLAQRLGIPIAPVNHGIGHIEIGRPSRRLSPRQDQGRHLLRSCQACFRCLCRRSHREHYSASSFPLII